jgi:hypothetical protein
MRGSQAAMQFGGDFYDGAGGLLCGPDEIRALLLVPMSKIAILGGVAGTRPLWIHHSRLAVVSPEKPRSIARWHANHRCHTTRKLR